MKALVRIITTAEGRFANIEDLRVHLRDDDFVAEMACMIAVGVQRGRSSKEALQHAVGYWLAVSIGDVERLPKGVAKFKEGR